MLSDRAVTSSSVPAKKVRTAPTVPAMTLPDWTTRPCNWMVFSVSLSRSSPARPVALPMVERILSTWIADLTTAAPKTDCCGGGTHEA